MNIVDLVKTIERTENPQNRESPTCFSRWVIHFIINCIIYKYKYNIYK